MAGRKLASTVHVHKSENETVIYGPEDDVPAADAKLITNEDAWESDEDDEDDDKAPSRPAPHKK